MTTLPQLMAAAVEANPGGRAVIFADALATRGQLDYAELDARSTRLARVLIERGVGPEDLVAVGIPRSIESVVAVWAVAKSGAGFVPIDPNYPADRVQHMVKDSGVVLGLTVAAAAETLPGQVDWLVIDDEAGARERERYSAEPITFADRVRQLRAEHPAYVIYTSGSTGLPKGVVVTQAGLSSFCDEQRERYRLTPDSRTLHFASPSFDASVLELLLALGGAGTMVVAAPTVYGGDELANLLRREGVTHAFITPAALASGDPAGLDELRVVVAGGEACPPDLVRRWVRPVAGGTREFFNGYGPTETTIMTNISAPLSPEDTVTIGGPIRAVTEYVLDERLTPVPTGVAGELYITGAQLARGYHERPGLTAQRFVANPFADNGSRLYRTGDLVRWTADGDLEYLGRNDFQVKIRGFRIELGEIDAVLGRHDSVDFAVTVGHRLDTGATILVAYVHPADGAEVDTDALLAFASNSLPAHMVPTSITVLDEIPLTPVGKLDRRALPTPRLQTTAFREPSGWAEQLVAEVFAELLGTEAAIGADDDFFELGGNSLIATQVAARLGAAVDARIAARVIFEAPTVAALAERLEAESGSGGRRALAPMPRPERIPLSPAQQRMWFLNQFDTASAANNIPFALRLTGALDLAALHAAIADVLDRHESLRTVYPASDGAGHQVILPVEQVLPELTAEPMTPERLPQWLGERALAGFDVAAQVPLRIAVAELGRDEHVLAVVVHHIAADGTSMAPLATDLMTAYLARIAGAAPEWKPLPVQYADYTLWQRDLLGDEDDPGSLAARQLTFWRQALAGIPDRIDLPADRPRPTRSSGRGAALSFAVDAETTARLDGIAQDSGASLFMVVHAAFAALLARLSGSADITIGTPVAGRGERELDGLIGMFVNTLVLRTEIDPQVSFTELLDAVKETDLAAFAHTELPFERLVDALDPVRSQAHHPLFQVALFFQNMTPPALELPGLSVQAVEFDGAVAKFDLQLTITPVADGSMSAQFTYATDLFDEATVAEFAARLRRTLRSVAADAQRPVGDIDLLSTVERDRILHEWNDTRHLLTPELLLDGYRHAVAAHADAVALVYEGQELTYREFDERVNRLARLLIAQGVGAESLVGLAVRRSLDLVVGMYAIVAAGGAYVPLDPDHPAERIAYILDTAQPVAVVTTTRDAVEVPAGLPVLRIDALDLERYAATPIRPAELLRPVRPQHPAYVIFTSGSTGRPKGVAVTHAAINNQIEWMLTAYPLRPDDVYLQKTATTFDVSLWGFFMPLRTGAKLVIATPDGHRDPAYVAETIAAQGVTVTDFVPSMLTVFAAHTRPGSVPTLRELFVIGEALPPETVAAVHAICDASVHNLYGPTEAAVSVTYWQTDGDEQRSVPIGLPQWNTRVYVLDSRLRPVPPGVAGELYLAGDQLARGYVRRPDLTADRFVANPFGTGERMYRTGDLVVWRGRGDDAVLDYLGRTDFQVKFRGQRIELGEIETALLAQPSVSQAVALVMPTALGDQLVAYAVASPGMRIEQQELRAAIAESLPAYMVPATIVALDEFPLNPSGKLDRKALPEPEFESRSFRAAATPVEEIVAGVFADVLGVGRVGVDDDFFELGGNSLIVTQAVSRLGAALGVRVPVRTLFETPTVGALAAAVESQTHGRRTVELGSIERPDQLPLSLAQRRMWFLNRFDQDAAVGSSAYNLPFALRLTGALDVDALDAALADVVARHEVLRTVYPETPDGPVQVILPPDDGASGLSVRTVAEADVPGAVYALASTPFDVTGEVPLRAVLLRVRDAGRGDQAVAEGAVGLGADASADGVGHSGAGGLAGGDSGTGWRTGGYSATSQLTGDDQDAGRRSGGELGNGRLTGGDTAACGVTGGESGLGGVPGAGRLTGDEHGTYVLAVVVHHIAGDASSMAPLVRDVMIAYAARAAGVAPEWEPLPVQYADYALWQREVLGDEDDAESVAAQQIAFWREQLAGLPDVLELPADRPRPAVASMAGGKVPVAIDAETHAGLVALAREHNATLFMVVHTAFAVLLSRLSSSGDIAIGTPVAGRGERELDDLIGMFVNTVVFRTRIDGGESFADLLTRQRDIDLQAFAHADIPFERLVEVLNPPRSTAHHPLFQVGLSFQNVARAQLELPGLAVSGVDADLDVSQFDLHLIVGDAYDESGTPTGIGGFFTYATDLFDESTVRAFADRLGRVLTAVVAQPDATVGDIELLDPAEREQVTQGWNATEHPLPDATTLAAILDAAVAAEPDRVAIVADTQAAPISIAAGSSIPGITTLTYRELDERVNRLARHLIAQGVGPEARVALALRRSVDLVVAMYAVTRAGGAYVPVDPDQPAERTGYILATAEPVCVLTNAAAGFDSAAAPVISLDELDLEAQSAAPITDDDRLAPLRPEHTAYVIFTSGSTGRPKGVAVAHRAIVNQLRWKTAEFGLTPEDAVLLKTAATFDLSVWEFWSAAACAGRLVIAAPDGHRDPAYLADLMADQRVSTLHVVPSMLDALVTAGLPAPLRRVLAIGEALPAALAQRVLHERPGIELFNLYGPTEAAVSITAHRVTGADQSSVPIGAPEWNSRVYVLDARLRPVAPGVTGELYLAGAQLARAYVARPDLTAERFVANPFEPGARMYRTGDLAAWTTAGELEYRGRTDFQVKIRGFRIELGEIEAALLQLPGVAQAAVVANSDEHTGDRLVAYLVPDSADATDNASADAAADEQARGTADTAPGDRQPSHSGLPATRPDLLDDTGRTRGEPASRHSRHAALPQAQDVHDHTLGAATHRARGLTSDRPRHRAEDEVSGAPQTSGSRAAGARSRHAAGSSLTAVDVSAVKSALSQALPSYMVPSAFVVLDALPLTINGKLDRKALPEPEFEAREFRAPSTPVEEAVAGVFAEVLRAEQVGADDDFFALGGNSLLATQVAARLGAVLDARIPVRALFEASTVAGLAANLAQHAGSGRRALTPMPRPDHIPLSLAQQRMWFLNQFDTSSAVYNIPAAIRLTGELDAEALAQAITDLVARHEILRTTYPQTEDGPIQSIASAAPVDLAVRTVAESEVADSVRAVVAAGFDVTRELPFRTALLRITPADHVLVFVAHHISADGWSLGPLTRDLMLAYAARSGGSAPHWTPLPVQYADYSLWQREILGDEADPDSLVATQTEYWRGALAGLPEELPLPADRPRPATVSYRGETFAIDLPADLHAALERVAAEHNATLFMVVHAALAVFLARMSGTDDIAIGTPVAGRGEAELDDVIGMFVNTLVLRSHVRGELTFGELLAATKDADLQAFAHADLPFERLVELLNPERSTARHPLFQVALSFENLPDTSFELPGLHVEAVDFDVDTAKFDLSLTIREAAGDDGAGMYAEFSFARDLFDDATVEVFAQRFTRLLESITAAPQQPVGDLPILADAEYELLTHVHGEDVMATGLLPDLLTHGARINPDQIAVRYEGRSITYRELDEYSSRLARVLIDRGVGPERIVALSFPRSYEMVAAFWAVAKAGGAHVPVDPSYPEDRMRHMVNDSGAVLGLTAHQYLDRLPREVEWLCLDDPVTDELIDAQSSAPVTEDDRISAQAMRHPASVSYTSGSTGLPKGVMVTHAGIGGLADVAADLYHLESHHRFLHICSPSFDPSVLEWVVTHYTGATLVIVPSHIIGGPDLAELLRAERVTHTVITPAVLGTVDPEGLDELEVVSVGGDVTTQELLAKWEPGRKYFNAYGPTETTIISSYARLTAGSHVTIGFPVHGMTALVLDARLNPVPPGVAGELYLAGGALARGYHNRPDLTADRFVANPWSSEGARMYRTGDVVRWYAEPELRAGNAAVESVKWELDYVGRSDFQVKIRGFRVELGEIDTALGRHPDVEFAITLGRETEAGATILVSYVLATPGHEIDTERLTEFVARSLPPHMVPSAIVVLDEIPLTPVGKLDRKALPEPQLAPREFRAPVTEVEAIIAEVFAEVLGVDQIGVDDSFFALGGDSILSIQLVSRAKARGVVFTPRDVFERRSVASLAEVATLGAAPGQISLEELPGGGVGEIPLTPIMAQILSGGSSFDRFSQSMALRLPDGIDRTTLVATIAAVFDHHDVLRSRLRRNDSGWTFEALERGAVDVDALVHRVDAPADISEAGLTELATAEFDAALGRLDPAGAAMAQFVWFAFDGERRDVLLIVAHHFVVDGVSWRILIPDFAVAWSQLAAGQPVSLPANGTSMRRWAHSLVDAAADAERVAELPFWQEVTATPDPQLGARAFDPEVDTFATVERVEVSLSAEVTDAVLTAVPSLYRGGVNDGLLSALAMAVARWRGGDAALIKLEGHGREEEVVPGADLSRTVGWFTAAYPVRLALGEADLDDAFAGGAALGAIVKSVKEQLLAVPDKGLGYGMLRYLNDETGAQLAGGSTGQISFNYLGRMSAGEIPEELTEVGWVPVDDLGRLDVEMDRDMPANAVLDINAIVTDGADGPELGASLAFPSGLLTREQVREFADLWVAALEALAAHARRPDAGGFTPSDMALVHVGQSDLEQWEREFPALTEVWPLSPLQSGLLFHALMTQATVDVYTMQAVVDLGGSLDVSRLRAAAQGIIDRYPNLRTAFVTDSSGQAVQVVLDKVEAPWTEVDLRELPEAERLGELQRRIAADQATHFDMAVPPLMRFTLFRTGETQWHLAITTHHILLDGWSMPLLMRDLLVLYAVRGDQTALPRVASYRNFLGWLAGRDREESLRAWARALDGLGEPTQLAPQPRGTEDYAIGKLITEIDADRTRKLTKHAAELGVTVNTLVQAAWGILLGRLTGRADVVFGATVSGRPAELPGVESMVGLFINTLPVRVRIDDRQNVGELLEGLQHEQADLLDHHYVGLTDIQRVAGPASQFDTLLVFESYPMDKEAISAASSIDGMSVTGVGVNDATHYPLTLLVTAESTIELTLKYLRSRFTAEEVEVLSTRLQRVLDALVGDPAGLVGDIDILDAGERARLLADSGIAAATAAPEPVGRVGARTVAKVLAEVVEEDPQAPALLAGDEEIAFQVLDRRSSQLARLLIAREVGPGDVVAVTLPRSVDSVVAAWAVQKAGAALLFATGLTTDEIRSAGAAFVIGTTDGLPGLDPTDPEIAAELTAAPGHPVSYTDRARPLGEDHPAFVLLTDGTPTVLTQTQALDRAEHLREVNEIDYESATFTTAGAGRPAVDEFLTATTAGALSVLPTGADPADDIADGEVTHWFVASGEGTDGVGDVRIVGEG
ncbi:amino acid adenylation domain-containing protein [Nocardia cyriacigeorgica]|uniref:amino acid adenylation domain-containing protein n=1 Tax=Nocardia cyriacigeorgica TaxID=135487 RepID=UPI003D7792E7